MKPRHHLYLDDALTAQLNALAARPGTSKSAIVADALRIRLHCHARQLARVERDVEVLPESLGLFVRYQLTVPCRRRVGLMSVLNFSAMMNYYHLSIAIDVTI